MDHSEDFVIENGVLKKYNGSGGNVVVPEGVTIIDTFAFYICIGLTSITLPESVVEIRRYAFYHCSLLTSITLSESVTRIESSAFEDCGSLTSITLPESVTEICEEAFYGCSGLEKITVAENNPNYTDHDGILFSKDLNALIKCPEAKTGSVTLPEGVTKIGEKAFFHCHRLTSITLPESVTEIGSSAFERCTLLGRVSVSSKIKIMGSAFDDSAHAWLDMPYCLPNKTIRERSVVQSCPLLLDGKYTEEQAQQWEKYIRSQRKKLYDLALQEEAVLQYMLQSEIVAKEDIDDLIEKAGNPTARSALMGYADKHVTIKGREKKQDQESEAAFTGIMTAAQAKKDWSCENIGSDQIRIKGYKGEDTIVSVPVGIGKRTVTEIGEYAFSPKKPQIQKAVKEHRSAITEIILPAGVTKIEKHAFFSCKELKNITLPEGMTEIEWGAFSGCSGLTSITLPEGIIEIKEWAFSCCDGLKSITLPKSLTTIGEQAFSSCHGLTSITIPGGVTKIGIWVFSGCSGLTSITIPESVTEIDSWAFAGCKRLTIHAPAGSYAEAYAKEYNIPFAAE